MCEDCESKHPKCPFCNIQAKFCSTWFTKEKKNENLEPCEAWIDYERDEEGEFLWYAVLNGDQYTTGNALVILGCHMDTITEEISDNDKKREKIRAMMEGINKVSLRLKETLKDIQKVHILCLCEGQSHLHFHLIPRYCYIPEEYRFFKKHFSKRAKKMDISKEFKTIYEKGEIHGMWYDAYQEMHWVETEYNNKTKKERRDDLEALAKKLRPEGKKRPSIFDCS